MSITDLFVAGGIVMYPLLAFSIVAIALIIERCLFWYKVNKRHKRLVREVLTAYRTNSDTLLPKLRQNIDLPIARIFLEALEVDYAPPQAFRLALEGATEAELPMLQRFNTVFSTIITGAPLLGLLGTVLGLIRTFASLDIGGAGGEGVAEVTAGISEALVSTACGMVVALFALLFYGVFRGLYKRQLAQVHEHGNQLEVLHLFRHEERRSGVPMRAE
ncbi:MAG: MotA/TolQ/ExbB proton channel family protein [Oscillatoriophycideae cyanobacterium NC_groundwater_1537_Pr4_S-0.65um_50_18]|nr:MotA/TolQ/ExbB proton channel family protein [Oscillatoriophycideae cyanobacterium NC_groundwater_1537_Pr4_S-0.65um_50_18]